MLPFRRGLRLLVAEDTPGDTELMVASLHRAGYLVTFDLVDSPDRFRERLQKSDYDVVVSDHNLRSWTGMDALDILRKSGRDIPFVIATGTLGDEAAVEYMKQGASDYVLKHRLERLPVAISHALSEKEHRQEAAHFQKQILSSKRDWELTFDTVPDPVLVLDRDCRVQRANRATGELLGLRASELTGKHCYEVLHGTSEPPAGCPHQQMLASGLSQRADFTEQRFCKTFDATASPLRDTEGSLVGCIHVLRDITDRKRVQLALSESEEKYRELVDNATYGIFRATVDGGFFEVNPALVTMLGYDSKTELQSRSLREIYENAEEIAAADKAFESRGRTEGCEVNWKRKDGMVIAVRLSGRVIRDEQGKIKYFDVIAEDISGRRVLEEQLRQAQKMEAVGRLAGGVAHDFNNLLGVVLGYGDLLLESSELSQKSRDRISEINKAAKRAAEVTRQLLAFSRKQVLETKTVNLNRIVSETSSMLTRLIGEDVELVLQLNPELGMVKVDPNQIVRIIMNLAVNARDAMPNGGKLTIETENAELDESYGERHMHMAPGGYVMLALTDTGTGMDSETQEHIFEPFFTTKEKDRGTGLGLSTVYGIVKQSGGHIWVYSEVGHGTTFKVYLPRAQGAEEAVGHSPALQCGSETILLVEDDASLRNLDHELLDRLGYHVLQAADGAAAVKVAEQYPGPIHLLMTDVVMPGMNGRELAERLLQSRSGLKILYVSGYTHNVIPATVLNSGQAFLQKPFTRDLLATKLRELLDGAAESLGISAATS